MHWWMLPSLLGTATSLVTAFYAYRYVRHPANRCMALLALAAAWVCAMQLAGLFKPDDLNYRLLMSRLQYLGFTTGPAMWMLTALTYCGYHRVVKLIRFPVWIIPAVTLIFALNGEWNGLIWERLELRPGSPGLDIQYGPWFRVHVFYVYSVVLTGTLVFSFRFARSGKYWRQLLAVALAPVAVFGLNFNFLLGLNPLPVDPTPAGLAVAALLLTLAVRKRLFTVAPVTLQSTLDSLAEGIIVVGSAGRIADTNRAARELLGIRGSGIGERAEVLLPQMKTVRRGDQSEVALPEGRWVNLRIIPMDDSSRPKTVLVLRDITEERAARERLMQVQRELRELNDRLEEMAHTDGLTGLANRRGLTEALEAEWSRSVRHGRPVSFLILDVDHFKQINDGHGHQTGDQVLRTAGQALRKMTRSEDIAARYGGDELALLLPETDLDTAAGVARRLLTGLLDLHFASPGGDSFGISVSMGLACREPEDSSPEALIARADAALYHTKQHGRGSFSVARGREYQLDGEALRHPQPEEI